MARRSCRHPNPWNFQWPFLLPRPLLACVDRRDWNSQKPGERGLDATRLRKLQGAVDTPDIIALPTYRREN